MDILVGIVSSPLVWIAIVVLYTLKMGIYFVPQNQGYEILPWGGTVRL